MTIQKFTSLNPRQDVSKIQTILGAQKSSNGLTPHGTWYAIKNLSEQEAELTMYGDIGDYGITAHDFVRDISAIKASKITLRVNSYGGAVDDGVAIFNAIRRHNAQVTAYVDGIAASAASFIVMAADRIIMSPHSKMMIHDALGFAMGNAQTMRETAEILDVYSDDIASIYAARAGGTKDQWRDLMRAEKWLSDKEAVDLGLADGIDGEEPQGRKVAAKVDDLPQIDFRALINEQIEVAADVFAA